MLVPSTTSEKMDRVQNRDDRPVKSLVYFTVCWEKDLALEKFFNDCLVLVICITLNSDLSKTFKKTSHEKKLVVKIML